MQRSSESRLKIQSCRHSAIARLRRSPKPWNGICTTRAPRRLRDLGGAVGAAGIGHHDLVRPQHARHRVRDLFGFVIGEDIGRYFLHVPSLSSRTAAHGFRCHSSRRPVRTATESAITEDREHAGQRSVPDLISVIVTTYNREDALEAVLRRCRARADRGFEVVVADDGSRPATAALVERWRPRLGVPLGHVWQDRSRLSRRRNPQPRNPRLPRRLLRLPRRRLHRAARFHRDPSPAGGAGLVRHRQPRAALAGADRRGAARRPASPRRWSAAEWIAQRLRGGVNRLAARAAAAARARCASSSQDDGAARAPAISRSGAPISSGSTASTRASAAGAARIPIC